MIAVPAGDRVDHDRSAGRGTWWIMIAVPAGDRVDHDYNIMEETRGGARTMP